MPKRRTKGGLKTDLKEFMAREKASIEAQIASSMTKAMEKAPPDPLVRAVLERLTEFTLRDGKRIRPIMTVIGYLACGGPDLERIRKAAISMELIQSMLLIHDDIMDRSDMRRGGPSFHRSFDGADQEIGSSMAIIGGDLAESLAESALTDSGFPPGRCIKALRAQAEMVRDTGYGQILDISLTKKGSFSRSDIERLQKYKTAIYTFDGPLRIGGILAGASKHQLDRLRAYAIPVGISFQIMDDVLGFFGDPKKGGNSDISDLKEGKRTLMLLDLMEMCSEREREDLARRIGSPSLDQGGAEAIRDMARSLGADGPSRREAQAKVAKGIAALEGVDLEPEMKDYLVMIAKDLLRRV